MDLFNLFTTEKKICKIKFWILPKIMRSKPAKEMLLKIKRKVYMNKFYKFLYLLKSKISWTCMTQKENKLSYEIV